MASDGSGDEERKRFKKQEVELLSSRITNRNTSMSRTGNCYDNAMAESFFSTLEFELRVNLAGLTFAQVHRELADYIEHYYNRKRMHSAVDYKSPVSYEAEQMAA